MVIYELLKRKEDWWVYADNEWGDSVSGKLYCRSCGRVRRDLYPRPIDIRVRQLRPGRSIGSSFLLVIGFIHRRLLARLAEHLTGFAIGDVYDLTGAKLEDHRTFYSANYIIDRRSGDSEIRQCLICGEIRCLGNGDRYVLKHQLGYQHVYQDAISTTYVDEWVAARVNWREFRDIELLPVPVFDEPPKGAWRLPGDPDWPAMGIPCKEWKSKVLDIPSLKNADMGPWPQPGDKQGGSGCEVVSVVSPGLPPRPPAEQSLEFKYFAGPLADMAHFAGETKPCSLCGRTGPCFELEQSVCPEIPRGSREGKIGCVNCLRAGRFEFVHNTEIGTVGERGLRSELTGKLYLPEGFSEASLVELRRTPQIATNQEEVWLTHCNDFMQYQGVWEPSDFCENAPDGKGRALFLEMTDPDGHDLWKEDASDEAEARAMWYGTYYVFKCLHCGKLRGNWDVD